MQRRTFLTTAAAGLAMPALVPSTSLGQAMRRIKIGSAFTTTTNAAYLMPKYLKEAGIDAQIISFPSLVQRMQAIASGDVDVGNGGLSATMQVSVKGVPMTVLANGCGGGWMLLAKSGIGSFADLRGKKIGVQNGSIALVSLLWKLKHEGLDGQVDVVYMDNQDQPIPLMRGDVQAICCFEPYATLAELQGWGKKLWVPYDTPMGKTNLGFVASAAFVKRDPDLTRTLVQAHVKATNEIAADPHIAVQTTIDQFKMSPAVAEASTRNLFFSADSGPAFQDGLKALAGMMVDAKLLDREPDWAGFIDTSFVA